MLYRKLGKTGCDVSVLGFGCMRFPIFGGTRAVDLFDPNKPNDERAANEMIAYTIEHGINYFDTAYPCHGGQSEVFLGKHLKPYREKIFLATKLPTWLVQGQHDFGRILTEQLKRLDTDYIDGRMTHPSSAIFASSPPSR